MFVFRIDRTLYLQLSNSILVFSQKVRIVAVGDVSFARDIREFAEEERNGNFRSLAFTSFCCFASICFIIFLESIGHLICADCLSRSYDDYHD